MIYPNLAEARRLAEYGFVSVRKHPTLPLHVYNYTPKAVHEFGPTKWNDTLAECRGLILDEDGEIVGRSMKKFWNIESLESLPAGTPNVYEKLDGSLGILANYNGQLVIATRGSFESEQAIKCAEILKRRYPKFDVPPPGITLLGEIVYPANRIVVDYGGMEDFVLLAAIDNVTGMDSDPAKSIAALRYGFTEATQYAIGDLDPKSICEVTSKIKFFDGQEGFVLRWPDGTRAKAKFADYCRLHRLITQVSTTVIWEMLRAGQPLTELLERVPEDFQKWVRETSITLRARHETIKRKAHDDFDEIYSPGLSRKDYAGMAVQTEYPSLMFALLDDKPIDDMIWKMVRPEWSTPFRRDIDEG